MDAGLAARGFVVLLLVGLPVLTTGEEALEEVLDEVDDRTPLYLSAALSLLLVAGVTWGVAAWAGVGGREVGWLVGDLSAGLTAGGVAAAGGLAAVGGVSRLARRLGWEESRAVFFLLPRGGREKAWFVLLALAAAVCEEYVYRGFALHVVEAWTGSAWPAVAVTSVSFGLAHGYQRTAGVLRATLLGVLLAAPVVRTGSLFPAVAAHFGINAVIGLGGWRWLAPGIRRSEPGDDGGRRGKDEDERTKDDDERRSGPRGR